MPYCNECGNNIPIGRYCIKCSKDNAYEKEPNSIGVSTRIKPSVNLWLKQTGKKASTYLRMILEEKYNEDMKKRFL